MSSLLIHVSTGYHSEHSYIELWLFVFFFIFAFPSEVNGTEEKLISTQFERILASLWLKETFKIQFCDSVKFVS